MCHQLAGLAYLTDILAERLEEYHAGEAAGAMEVTIPTINSFRARIKEKLQLKNGAELAFHAMQCNGFRKKPDANGPCPAQPPLRRSSLTALKGL